MFRRVCTLLAIGLMVATVSACSTGGTFRTWYDESGATAVARNWNVTDVRVDVPRSLSVSEARTLVPHADIVWQEEPLGNRYMQVAEIVRIGVLRGVSSLKGPQRVRLEVTVSRFHAMTLQAEALNYDVGVHNIAFTITAVDARSGKVLAGPSEILAEFPALTGAKMINARLRGESQKSQIIQHISSVIAGWVGTGPDPRMTFVRLGG